MERHLLALSPPGDRTHAAVCRHSLDSSTMVFDGISLGAVPVHVEDACQPRHDRAHEEHVHVDKIADRVTREVFVGNVAPTHHRDDTIRDEQLVVHPTVDVRRKSASEATNLLVMLWRAQRNGLNSRTSTLGNAARPRNIGSPPIVLRSSTRRRTRTPRNAASRRLRINSRPVRIVLHQVVLDIERMNGAAHELHARIERVEAERHQPEAGHGRVGCRVVDKAHERTVGRCLLRTRGRAVGRGRKGSAGRDRPRSAKRRQSLDAASAWCATNRDR